MSGHDTATEILRLTEIMKTLRSPEGCPWDRQQTAESLKSFILEEAHELLEAIDEGDPLQICDEIGDVLLQTVFLSQIFAENGQFNFADAIYAINEKMIRRHPHVFSTASSTGHEERWERIKLAEKSAKDPGLSLEKRISRQLPALKRASKAIQKIEKGQKTATQLLASLAEQISTVNVDQINDRETGSEFLSETIFNIVRLSSACNLDAEELLRKKTTEYIRNHDNTNNTNRQEIKNL